MSSVFRQSVTRLSSVLASSSCQSEQARTGGVSRAFDPLGWRSETPWGQIGVTARGRFTSSARQWKQPIGWTDNMIQRHASARRHATTVRAASLHVRMSPAVLCMLSRSVFRVYPRRVDDAVVPGVYCCVLMLSMLPYFLVGASGRVFDGETQSGAVGCVAAQAAVLAVAATG